MTRRTFSKQTLGAILGASVIGASAKASGGAKGAKPFKCKFAANIYKWTNLCPTSLRDFPT